MIGLRKSEATFTERTFNTDELIIEGKKGENIDIETVSVLHSIVHPILEIMYSI